MFTLQISNDLEQFLCTWVVETKEILQPYLTRYISLGSNIDYGLPHDYTYLARRHHC